MLILSGETGRASRERQGIGLTSLSWKTQSPGGITHIDTKAAFIDRIFPS